MLEEGGRIEEKIQGIRSISGRYKINRESLRIVWEIEMPKNLHVHGQELRWGNAGGKVGTG